jgi:lipoprotein
VNTFIKNIAFISIILLLPMFTSCEDEPEESDIKTEIVGRGESFTATMGSLQFRIINNYPDILPAEGLSNYLDAPSITYIGEVESLNAVKIPSNAQWNKKCEIIDCGGYVAQVKWYDPSSRDDRDGYIYMYVEKIGDSHPDTRPGVFHDEIRVTYKLKAQ